MKKQKVEDELLQRRLDRLELAERLEREVQQLKDDLLPARQRVSQIQRAINKKEAELHQSLQPLPLFDGADNNGHPDPSEEWLAKPVSELAAKGVMHKICADLEAAGIKTYGDLAQRDKETEGGLSLALTPILGGFNAQQVAQTFYRLAKKAK
jgi:hypothetical protein